MTPLGTPVLKIKEIKALSVFSKNLTIIIVQAMQKEMRKRLRKSTLTDNYTIQIDFTKIFKSIITLKGQFFGEVQKKTKTKTLLWNDGD